jgi:hypothetical protein
MKPVVEDGWGCTTPRLESTSPRQGKSTAPALAGFEMGLRFVHHSSPSLPVSVVSASSPSTKLLLMREQQRSSRLIASSVRPSASLSPTTPHQLTYPMCEGPRGSSRLPPCHPSRPPSRIDARERFSPRSTCSRSDPFVQGVLPHRPTRLSCTTLPHPMPQQRRNLPMW